MAVLPEILIVEDDAATQMLLAAVVSRLGFHPTVTADGAAALSMIAARPIAVMLLDILMPKMSGLDVLRQLKLRAPQALPRTIVLTVATEITSRHCPELVEIAAFLRKPVDIDVLATTIDACAESASPHLYETGAGGLETEIRQLPPAHRNDDTAADARARIVVCDGVSCDASRVHNVTPSTTPRVGAEFCMECKRRLV